MASEMVPPGGPPTDPKWLEQLVENQKQEIALKANELELEKQRDNNNLSWARESLAAQERDRKHERECQRDKQKDRQRFVLFLLGIIAAVVLVALWLGKDAVATEIAKAVVFVAAGSIGGYGYARSKAEPSADLNQSPSEPSS
ncbi:MAG: hypothetical protein ABFC67_04790 [Mizugakiibacter sp.]|uniref:hypothetical protein n=1 Tax=Mizugakiibacter sp. TaxID=1972610 RepID=UPI00320E3407